MAQLPWHWSLGGLPGSHEEGDWRKEGEGSDRDRNRQWTELGGQEEGGVGLAGILLSSLCFTVSWTKLVDPSSDGADSCQHKSVCPQKQDDWLTLLIPAFMSQTKHVIVLQTKKTY